MVYIVTSGSYSDYHIVGAFTDRKKAVRLVKAYPKYTLRIEEFPLDKYLVKPHQQCYRIEMDKEGNTLETATVLTDTYWLNEEKPYTISIYNVLQNYCFANDEQHAIKITNELRTQLIVEGIWV